MRDSSLSPPRSRRRDALGLTAALALAVPFSVLPVRAEILINPDGWRFPNIITAAKEVIRVSDRTPLIPGKETIRKGYRKADGTYFMTYEIEGRIFGAEIDTDGKPPFEYSIMDTDGDGKFETKIPNTKTNTDRAYVPQWVIDHYYAMHPELKQGTGSGHAPAPTLRPVLPPPKPTPTPPLSQVSAPPPEVLKRPTP
jgi:hypothetical protein